MSRKCVTSLLAGLLLSTSVYAETVYVSDIQFVAIREGLDNSTRAVERGLKSGTPLEILERSEGYSKVRTPSGNEGWVADYFLSEDTVTRDKMSALQSQVNRVTESRNDIANTLKASQQKIQELIQENTQLKNNNSALEQELSNLAEISEKAKEIVSKNETISYEMASLKQRTDAAVAQANQLQKSNDQRWFIIGAGTLFGGLFLGILLPSLRRKKAGTGSW
ncbi:TIGR04211 family SH3 domain-containing protein [Marinomonas sp. GJ51-6]|uniref:TIGR04211 family SH3 domain-containing protein n=1 Tax=Marinomonas sp. GJ51-6 TaxID=2992802 RepID=UPI00293416F5|nr:TIGR04211 family SH3 domain-containing protein [Marinomonas sp. GJ51-6]WOD07228.1 TIGR04211 family SH3 domain-containing protein [Marinomonas sp. GJ51-6]